MAEESIVDKMWKGTKYWGNWARNAAGGVYNTYAGLTDAGIKADSGQKYGITPLPVQAALSALRNIGGGASIPTVRNSGGAQYIQNLTGLPTQKTEPGFEAAFGFGRGAATGPTAGAAMMGGAISAGAEQFIEDPKVRALVEAGLPIAMSMTGNMLQGARKGALRDVGNATDTTIPMDKGRAANIATVIDDADMLASNAKTADRVNKIKQANASRAETTLRKFIDKSVKSSDAEAGKQAAIGWNAFRKSREEKFKAASQRQFDKAYAITGDKAVIDLAPVKKALMDLRDQYSGIGQGRVAQDILADVNQRLDELSSIKKVSLQEAQTQLETLNRLAKGDTIGVGSDVGAIRKLKGAWQDTLRNTTHEVDKAGKPTLGAEGAKALISARRYYKTGIDDLKTMDDQALSVFFDQGKTGERIMLKPEQIMQKLRSMKPTEREFYVSVMELQDPAAIKALRANILDDIITKGQVVGGSVRSAEFSPSKFLREFDKRREDLEFLLPSKADRAGFEAVVQDLRRASADPNIVRTGVVDATSVATGAAGMMTGKMGTQPIARGVLHTLENWLTDKNALVDLLYGGAKQPATKTGRAFKLLKDSTATPFNTNRSLTGAAAVSNIEGADELPPPPEGFFDAAEQAEEELPPPPEGFFEEPGVDMDRLLDNIEKAESNGNPKAVSPKGAKGAYQFMDATAQQYGVTDPFDPVQSREGARKYINDLLKQFNGDVGLALAAYNWGPGNLSKHGMEKAPEETKQYVARILGAL